MIGSLALAPYTWLGLDVVLSDRIFFGERVPIFILLHCEHETGVSLGELGTHYIVLKRREFMSGLPYCTAPRRHSAMLTLGGMAVCLGQPFRTWQSALPSHFLAEPNESRPSGLSFLDGSMPSQKSYVAQPWIGCPP
jgi:hypothetical protein